MLVNFVFCVLQVSNFISVHMGVQFSQYFVVVHGFGTLVRDLYLTGLFLGCLCFMPVSRVRVRVFWRVYCSFKCWHQLYGLWIHTLELTRKFLEIVWIKILGKIPPISAENLDGMGIPLPPQRIFPCRSGPKFVIPLPRLWVWIQGLPPAVFAWWCFLVYEHSVS